MTNSATGHSLMTMRISGGPSTRPADPFLKTTSKEVGGTAIEHQREILMVFVDIMTALQDNASGHGPRVKRVRTTPKACSAANPKMIE